MDVSSTQWQRSESVKQTLLCPCLARLTDMKFLLRLDYVATTSTLSCHALIRFLLRPDMAMTSLRFSKHVHSSTTSFTSTKKFLRSYRFLLRSTILSSYCVHPIFDDVVFRINTVTCDGRVVRTWQRHISNVAWMRKLPQFGIPIMAGVYVRSIVRSTMYQKAPFC